MAQRPTSARSQIFGQTAPLSTYAQRGVFNGWYCPLFELTIKVKMPQNTKFFAIIALLYQLIIAVLISSLVLIVEFRCSSIFFVLHQCLEEMVGASFVLLDCRLDESNCSSSDDSPTNKSFFSVCSYFFPSSQVSRHCQPRLHSYHFSSLPRSKYIRWLLFFLLGDYLQNLSNSLTVLLTYLKGLRAASLLV